MDHMIRIIEDIEPYDMEAIEECFRNGVSPNTVFRNEPLLHEPVSEYGRGPSFKQSVKIFVDHGHLHRS